MSVKVDMEVLIEEAVKDEVNVKREAFEALFKDIKPSVLDKWLSLPDYEFYEKLVSRVKLFKMTNSNDARLMAVADAIEEYTELKGEALLEHLETPEGEELLGQVNYLPLPRLVMAHGLGYVKFTGEAFVLTGAYAGRVGGKLVSELAKAAVATAKFAYHDGKNYKRSIGKSFNKHKGKSLGDILKDRE